MIELKGTLLERLEEAIRLIGTKVTEEEIALFYRLYEQAGIRLTRPAIDFFKQYGGSYRNKYIVLTRREFNKEICLNAYVPLLDYYYAGEFDPEKSEANALSELEDVMEFYDTVREFAGQDVCPIARIGYYYPADVFIGENGLLYCVYDFQEEIEVFRTPAEILASYLGNNVPVGVDDMPIRTK